MEGFPQGTASDLHTQTDPVGENHGDLVCWKTEGESHSEPVSVTGELVHISLEQQCASFSFF